MASFYESITAQQQAQYKMLEKMHKMGVSSSYGNHISPHASFMTSSGENFKDLLNRMANTQHSDERKDPEQSNKQSDITEKYQRQ